MLLYAEPGGQVYGTFWYATISDDSIALAIAVSVRVVALGLPTILLFGRTDPTELADALAQVAKLPSRFVLGVLAGTRTLGLFLDDWRSMQLARRSRGVGDTGAVRRFFSMAFVLLVFAVRRGEKLAVGRAEVAIALAEAGPVVPVVAFENPREVVAARRKPGHSGAPALSCRRLNIRRYGRPRGPVISIQARTSVVR